MSETKREESLAVWRDIVEMCVAGCYSSINVASAKRSQAIHEIDRMLNESTARITSLSARLAEAVEIIRDADVYMDYNCPYYDKLEGQHSPTCRIVRFLAEKGVKE